jgi:hypothetical protein
LRGAVASAAVVAAGEGLGDDFGTGRGFVEWARIPMSRKGSETWGTLRVSPSRGQLLDMVFCAGGELFFSPDVGDSDGPERYKINPGHKFRQK